MEFYPAVKNNYMRKFLGKWIVLEKIILSKVTQTQNAKQGMSSLVSEY